jgi:hypothetical protein
MRKDLTTLLETGMRVRDVGTFRLFVEQYCPRVSSIIIH